jgi:hypothetical protein
MKGKLWALAACAAASVFAVSSAQAQTTVNWNFTGTHTGSGQLTYDSSNVVTALSGTYDGFALSLVTFTTDPNYAGANLNPGAPGPGLSTYHGVPNTGGVDYIFDNLLPLTANGIVVSSGTGIFEHVYDISLDGSTPDFFSVGPEGDYIHDHGTFTTSKIAAVPEPATWAMMLGGFGVLGGALRRRQRTARAATCA